VYTPQNPSTAYREQSVLTATPGQLVLMMYDGCLRFLHQAAYALRAGDAPGCDRRLRRAEAIIDELLVTLDKDRGGVIASRLEGIYVFSKRHLIEARIEGDPAMIEKVSELLGELRAAWAEIAGS
jgi:flagellar protein FliS